MRLSDFKDDEAFEVLAELLEPVIEISSDKGLQELSEKEETKMFHIAQYIIRNHKAPLIKILAIMHRVPVKDYTCTAATLIVQVLELLGDPELMAFFKSQSPKKEEDASGSASENIVALRA